MTLQEFQGKKILQSFVGGKGTVGIVAYSPGLAVLAAEKIYNHTVSNSWGVKAQIHAGARSKAGGVKIANSIKEVRNISNELLGKYLVTRQTTTKGERVSKVLIEQDVYLNGEEEKKEYYMSLLIDRERGKDMFIYSTDGGIDIEDGGKKLMKLLFFDVIDTANGIHKIKARQIASYFGVERAQWKELSSFIYEIYQAYKGSYATLFEINPVLMSGDNKMMAVDAKVVIDDNARYRLSRFVERSVIEREDTVVLAGNIALLNIVTLEGHVGCLVNGAGLAMATMDMIKGEGGRPANFLDVGGHADAKRVETAIRLIMTYDNVTAILINIFGGIVRGDFVAYGIRAAYQGGLRVPLIVRIKGTNDKLANTMIDGMGMTVATVKEAGDTILFTTS